jgi:hypothetical protein
LQNFKPPFTLRFDIVEEDLFRYWLHSMLYSRIWKRKRIFQWFLFSIISLAIIYKLIFIRFEFGAGELIMLVLALYVGFLRTYFLRFLLRRKVRILLRQDTENKVLGEKEILFGDDVRMKSMEGDGTAEYSTFVAFEEDDHSFYLILPDTSGLIIPKRVFVSSEEMKNFQDFLRSKISVNAS